MNRYKSWTLTDLANDVWLDSFTTGSDRVSLAAGPDWSIRNGTLHGGLRDGVDVIEVDNGVLS